MKFAVDKRERTHLVFFAHIRSYHTIVRPIQSRDNLAPCRINKETIQHHVAPLQMKTLFNCKLYTELQSIEMKYIHQLQLEYNKLV